jgi:hypothetical protein
MIKNNDVLSFLEAANKIESDEERVSYFKENLRIHSAKVLACIHNPSIQFFSPGANFSYKKNETYGKADSKLSIEIRRLKIFLKDAPYTKEKKLTKLIQVCENIPGDEAEFLLNHILRKTNPFKNIGKVFLRNNFPEILNLTID